MYKSELVHQLLSEILPAHQEQFYTYSQLVEDYGRTGLEDIVRECRYCDSTYLRKRRCPNCGAPHE